MSNYDYNKFLSDSGDDYPTYEEVVRKYKAKKVLTDKQKPVSIKNNEIRNSKTAERINQQSGEQGQWNL